MNEKHWRLQGDEANESTEEAADGIEHNKEYTAVPYT